jgi:hypothetical protein
LRRSSPRRPQPKAARARAVVAGGGGDDVNLRFRVQGSRFPVLKFPILKVPVLRLRVLRFKVRNRIFRTHKGLLLSKILENQRMRAESLEP